MHRFPVVFGLAEFWSWKHCLHLHSLCTDVPLPQKKSGEDTSLNRRRPLPIFPEGGGTSVHRLTSRRGRYSWEFLVGVCRPVFQILSWYQTKKCNYPHLFSDLAFTQKLCYFYQIRPQIRKLFKSISNSHISLSFLLIWNWNDKNVHTLP